MKCPICNSSELTGKQKYCSGACRVKASRLGVSVSGSNKESDTESLQSRITSSVEQQPTDGLIHMDHFEKGICVRCGEKFTTSLELMRFCSPECKKEVMVVIADGPHKKYLEWLKQ